MKWQDAFNMVINALSAVGTLGATIIALFLALQDRRQRIDCAFMWEAATNDKPTLILNSIGNRTVIVERVDLYYCGKEVGGIDILRSSTHSKNAIISPNNNVRIILNSDELNLVIKGKPLQNPNTVYKLTAVVTTTNKKRYKSSYGYSYNDLAALMFLDGFS